MGVSISRLDPDILFDAYLPIVAICLIHYYIIFYYSQEDSEDLDMKSGPTSIHVSENCDENHNKTKQIDDNYPPEVVHKLRAEIFALKGQMKSECIYEIIDLPKYRLKDLIDFCPGRLFRLGMLCTHVSRVDLRIIKTNHMYLDYKTFQERNNLSKKFGGIFGKLTIF